MARGASQDRTGNFLTLSLPQQNPLTSTQVHSMNSPAACLEIQPRQPRLASGPLPPRTTMPEPPEDELRKLAFEIVQHDPVLAHLLVRAGERLRRN